MRGNKQQGKDGWNECEQASNKGRMDGMNASNKGRSLSNNNNMNVKAFDLPKNEG
jgi:hypothetical protein